MSFFTQLFGVSWRHLQAKVRYRILILTLVPILLTLVSLVFITIYWNISYTGKQLFMKVKADLTVAKNTLEESQVHQAQQLEYIMNSWTFQNKFQHLRRDHDPVQQQIQTYLNNQKSQLNLDFVRLISVSDAAADPELRLMLPHTQHGKAFSGLMVLDQQQLARINPALASKALIPLIATQRALPLDKTVEKKGLVSRSLMPIMSKTGHPIWYLDGGVLLNHDTRIVDHIRDLVYDKGTLPDRSIGAVTIFLDNVRIATNVPLHFFPRSPEQQGRALGSLVSEDVQRQVLQQGKLWVDRAFVYDDWFISAYAPLQDIRGKRIGMIYAGFSESPFIHNYLLNIIELGTILMLVLLVSGLLVYRGAYSLLLPIERIHQVVKGVQAGRNLRIGSLGLIVIMSYLIWRSNLTVC